MNKDWTGNSNSIFKSLAASNHSDTERVSMDFYATQPEAIDLLLKKVKLPHLILEPACGCGTLSERLKKYGHEVFSYDIVDRGYGEVQNFFEMLTLPNSLSLCEIGACGDYEPSIQVCSGGNSTLVGAC